MNNFYTYAYLREDGTPYYIGKGKNNRAYNKRKNEINLPKDKSRIIFLKQNLTEEEAFKHEIYMIFIFGRKDLGTGILRNKTNGGDGVSGIVVSQDTRIKQSISAKNRINPPSNKKYFTEEEKREAKRINDRKYQQKVKENRKEYLKKWRENNQDKIKKWKEENKEHLKELWKIHREKNRESRNLYSKEYRMRMKNNSSVDG